MDFQAFMYKKKGTISFKISQGKKLLGLDIELKCPICGPWARQETSLEQNNSPYLMTDIFQFYKEKFKTLNNF